MLLSEIFGDGAAAEVMGAVIIKSVSAPLLGFSPVLVVSYHTPIPPLLPEASPPQLVDIVIALAGPTPGDFIGFPPKVPCCTIHSSNSFSPGSSLTRSQDKTIKSPVMVALTSGSLRIAAVGVLRSRSTGAMRVGLGVDNEVKYGFCDSAASKGGAAEGGVMRVILVTPIR